MELSSNALERPPNERGSPRLRPTNIEMKYRRASGELVEASAVEPEWSGVLWAVRVGMLAVPSRVAQRLPHLTAHDVSEVDAEVRAVLNELGPNPLSDN